MSSYSKCALAAAYSAATGKDVEHDPTLVHNTLKKMYPVGKIRVNCPACDSYKECAIVDMIPHINDNHQWTWEKIAEWVATYEDKMFADSKDKAVSEAAKLVEEACKNLECKEDEKEAKKEKVLVKRK